MTARILERAPRTRALALSAACALAAALILSRASSDEPTPAPPALGAAPAPAPLVAAPREPEAPSALAAAEPAAAAPAPVATAASELHVKGYKVELSWDAEVAQASDLFARLAVVDRAVTTADPEDSVPFVERLLDRPPGRNAEEVSALRMALFSRLGLVKDRSARAVARLVAALDAPLTRPERLAAIDALARDGAIPSVARPALDRIADSDPDDEVRQRARRALGRGTG